MIPSIVILGSVNVKPMRGEGRVDRQTTDGSSGEYGEFPGPFTASVAWLERSKSVKGLWSVRNA